jgi:hypothetical protein
MGVISDDGLAAPFDADGKSYPPAGDLIPVLRSFYLAYDIGDPTPSDHQILSIETMVGGHSEVIDTILNFQPANITDGRLFPALQDQDPGGEQFYYKMSHSTLARAGVRRYQIQQVGNVGEVVRKLPSHIFQQGPISPALPGPFAALVGFRLFFQGRDNQVDRVGIWFDDDDLHVAFNTQHGFGDTYSFLVDFVVIHPSVGTNVSHGTESGSAKGGERVEHPIPRRHHELLTGWDFAFTNGRHNLRDIGVDRQGDNIVVFFADRNADDEFNWAVQWAQISPQVFA